MVADDKINYFEKIREFERKLVCEALAQTQGHQRKAANLLGLPPTTLSSTFAATGHRPKIFQSEARNNPVADLREILPVEIRQSPLSPANQDVIG